MIRLAHVAMSFGERILFDNVDLSLHKGQRYGIVGANGSGKTTLLKILAGEMAPTQGQRHLPAHLRLGVLQQNHFEYEQIPILDVVLRGRKRLWDLRQEQDQLAHYARLSEAQGRRIAELEILIADLGGYDAPAEAATILNGLGIGADLLHQPMAVLSGGYKLRVMLAQCLFSQPDALLFDEPNNHLDIYSIAWLADYLCSYQGITVVVSHDYHFLNQIATHILDIDYETVTMYRGNYQVFMEAKTLARHQKEQEIARLEKKQAELQAFYERFRAKATKARQAISRKKQLDRLEEIVIKRSSRIAPAFDFRQNRPAGQMVVRLTDLNKSYGALNVLRNLSFEVGRGQRLAVIGPNGIGKSTLIKILAGQLGYENGRLDWGYEVAAGYFPQNHAEIIPPDSTPYTWLYQFAPSELVSTIRSILGRMLFGNDDIDKRNAALSGGEMARLIFARLMLERPNLLLLDEPTNHLDLEAIEALSRALINYPGTVIFVSHDRHFVEQVGTAVLELHPAGFRYFEGNYTDFVSRKGLDLLDRDIKTPKKLPFSQTVPVNPKSKSDVQARRLVAKDLARLRNRIQQCENRIAELENRLKALDQLFADDSIYLPERQTTFQQSYSEQQSLKNRLEQEFAEWESLQRQVQEASTRLSELDSKQ